MFPARFGGPGSLGGLRAWSLRATCWSFPHAGTTNSTRFYSTASFTPLHDRCLTFRRPQHIFILDSIPASPTGKILKATLVPLAEHLIAGGKSVG
jgi:acyl-CoA synthetase (AMP-forming)/AMP-acid ligase II